MLFMTRVSTLSRWKGQDEVEDEGDRRVMRWETDRDGA